MNRKDLSLFLRVLIVLAAFIGVVFLTVFLPLYGNDVRKVLSEVAYMYWPTLIFIWISAIPVYAALWMGWKVCGEIRRDNSFCEENAARLRAISVFAVADVCFYVAGGIALLMMNLLHPGILLLGGAIVFIGIALAVVFAVLSYLTEKASLLKKENDLTV